MCTIAALSTIPCDSNAVGMGGTIYMAPAAEFSAWPAYDSGTDPGDSVTLSGNFSFVATSGIGYFRGFPCLIEKGSIVYNAVGGVGSKTFEVIGTYVIPGINAAQLEHIKQVANIPGVWLFTDKNSVVHVQGTKTDPAYIQSIEATSGVAASDERIATITVRSIQASPTIYTGTIDTTPNS